jgi:hypothetical protein
MQNKCVAVVLYNPKQPQKLLKNKAKFIRGFWEGKINSADILHMN